MELFAAIRGRRAVRRFRETPVPESCFADLVESLVWAPSSGNFQARRFVFATDADLRRRLAAAAGQEVVAAAPLILVGAADLSLRRRYGSRGVELYALQDVALAVQNYMLVAHSLGLGTTWVGSFNETETRRILDLRRHFRPVVLVPTGLPAETPPPPPRRPLAELISIR